MRLGFAAIMSIMLCMFVYLYLEHERDVVDSIQRMKIAENVEALSDKFSARNFQLARIVRQRTPLSPETDDGKAQSLARAASLRIELDLLLQDSNDLADLFEEFDDSWSNIDFDLKGPSNSDLQFTNLQEPISELRAFILPEGLISATKFAEKVEAIQTYLSDYEREFKPRMDRLERFLAEYNRNLARQQADEQQARLGLVFLTIVTIAIGYFIPSDKIVYGLLKRATRQSQITQRALEDAQKAQKSKLEFLMTMGHEIRTPMNGIISVINLLRDTDLDQRQKTFMDIIEKSGHALLELTNDVLDISKMETSQIELAKEPFNIANVVEGAGLLLQAEAQDKDIELCFNLDQTIPPFLLGDIGRLRQIMLNLMSHSVQNTERGHVMLSLTNLSDEQDILNNTMRIHFEITDTGAGISNDKIASFFDEFVQSETIGYGNLEVTGLSLAIASQLVKLMGGDLNLTSRVGEGSCFSFTLALPICDRCDNGLTQAKPSHILIVDDNVLSQKVMLDYCRAWGHDAIAVESADLALIFLKYATEETQQPIDLIITNYDLPDMTGTQFITTLRKEYQISQSSILVACQLVDKPNIRVLSRLNVQDILSKPYRVGSTHEKIYKALTEPMFEHTDLSILDDVSPNTEFQSTRLAETNIEGPINHTSTDSEEVILTRPQARIV